MRRLLGLSSAPEALMRKLGMGFASSHWKFVDHIVKGAQASWQLGRFTSIQSCTTPLAAGVSELPPGVDLDLDTQLFTSIPVSEDDLNKCGMATRAILARALNEGRDKYEWYREVPIYRLSMFSRPSVKGELRDNSVNSSKVSATRKHLALYNFMWGQWHGSSSQDLAVHKFIAEAFNDSVARTLRNKGAVVDNQNQRDRYGKKFYDGRVGKLCKGWPLKQILEVMRTIVERNGIKPIMDEILGSEIEGSLRLLVADESQIDTRTNEDHLKTDWVDTTVERLIGAGITREVVSTFSEALAIIDSISSACLRPQDALGCLARLVHFHEGELRYRMATKSKNFITLARSAHGACIDHDKSAIVLNAAAVFTVICRPLMRKLLERNASEEAEKLEKLVSRPRKSSETASHYHTKVEKAQRIAEEARGFKLGETTAPFTKEGVCYRVDDRRYGRLFQYVGQRCLGLSNWGANINRTIQVTLVLQDAAKQGMGSEHPEVRAVTGQGRHGKSSTNTSYMLAAVNGEFVQSHKGGMLGSSSLVTSAPRAPTPAPESTVLPPTVSPAPVTAPPSTAESPSTADKGET